MISADTKTPPETPTPGLTEQDALSHAWEWFRYHADQRMTMVRFAITVIGGIGAGVGLFWKPETYLLACLSSIFGAVVAYSALRIDRRTADLVKIGESALEHLQNGLAAKTAADALQICRRANTKKGHWPYSYTQNFSLIYRLVMAIFIVTAALSFALAVKLEWRLT